MKPSFYSRLAEHANNRRERAAVVAGPLAFSYPQLFERVGQGAAFLRAQGIDAQSAVGLSISDEVEHLVATLSLMALGATHIVLATHDPQGAREKIAKRARLTHTLATDKVFSIEGLVQTNWPNQLPPARAINIAPDTRATLLLRTSGTTGDMNLVPFSEEQLALQAETHPDYSRERFFRLASIEHNNSKRHRLYCLWAGGTNIFRTSAADEDLVNFVAEHDISCLDVSRIHAVDMADGGRAKALAARLKIRLGGSPLPIHVRRAILAGVTPSLFVRYGATECGVIAMAGPADHDDDETVGRPIPGVRLQVVDADSRPVPDGESGSIRLRAPGMATAYFDSPADSAKRFRDGWFYPGDIGRMRPDGQLIVQGRSDDMMILNGVNVFPAEIEQVLEQHPSVALAVALALDSNVHGQIPVAVVETRPGAGISPLELRAYAKNFLALRTPRKIIFVDIMPRTPQGKVSRHQLINLFQPAGE